MKKCETKSIAFCFTIWYNNIKEVVGLQFEWDEQKERLNIKKHGLDFETAVRVFEDENRLELYDEEHSEFEDRYITIGLIDDVACIVMVVYTEREETVRVISARKATKQEREMYYDYS